MGGGISPGDIDRPQEPERPAIDVYGLRPGWPQDHEELRAAMSDWIAGVYPEARMLGDVVVARQVAMTNSVEGLNNA